MVGCGVDAELIERFREHDDPDSEPWTALFSRREIDHNRRLNNPSLGFCASFCTKEALLKAVGVPIDYRSCELLFSPELEEQQVTLTQAFRDEHGVDGAVARVVLSGEPMECVVALCLWRRSIETVATGGAK